MLSKLPILIIIPHGGLEVPEELEEHILVDKYELFLSSDSCANDLFNFEKKVSAVVKSPVSKLFVDMNRHYLALPQKGSDGIIKSKTPYGKAIFREETLPDQIAIANIVKRYYRPFYQEIDSVLKHEEIRLIVECHTSFGIGLPGTPEADLPLPVATVYNSVFKRNEAVETCPGFAAHMLNELLCKSFEKDISSPNSYIVSKKPSQGYLMQHYAKYIPYIRLDLSRALFFDDRFFNLEYIKVDQLRIKELRKKVWHSLEKMYKKCIQ